MTSAYYVRRNEGYGWIVSSYNRDDDGDISARFICNFIDEDDAQRFCDDCNSAKIDDGTIEELMEKYTDKQYRYTGKGLKKEKKE